MTGRAIAGQGCYPYDGLIFDPISVYFCVAGGIPKSGSIDALVRILHRGLMRSTISSDLSDSSITSVGDRRKAPRYGLMAIAELADPGDARLLSGKVTQISRTGCYVETPKTFPVGTSLKVIISRDQRTFVAKANIIHVQEQIGMGLAFLEAPEDQLRIVDSWLAELPSTSANELR